MYWCCNSLQKLNGWYSGICIAIFRYRYFCEKYRHFCIAVQKIRALPIASILKTVVTFVKEIGFKLGGVCCLLSRLHKPYPPKRRLHKNYWRILKKLKINIRFDSMINLKQINWCYSVLHRRLPMWNLRILAEALKSPKDREKNFLSFPKR